MRIADFLAIRKLKNWWQGERGREAAKRPFALQRIVALFQRKRVPYRLIYHPDVFGAAEAGRCLVFLFLFLAVPSLSFGAEPKIEAARSALQAARGQLEIAIKQAEISLGPHQPGSGWTKAHMQNVLNLIEGKDGQDSSARAESLGDGHGVLRYLDEASGLMKESSPAGPLEALSHAVAFLGAASDHARGALRAKTISEVHAQARLAAGMLVAARGVPGTDSPVTGALTLALQAVSVAPDNSRPKE